MAITPQAIKDQEFQTKFRGYDPIEVKGYLELVAEEFFELLEKVRQQEEEIEVLSQEKGLLNEMNAKLEDDIETALKTTDDVRKEGEEKDAARAELEKELEELQTAQADLEEEQKELKEKLKDQLEVGQVVEGEITSLRDFGAFVDIGIKQNGLIHVSNMANEYVSEPGRYVKLNQKVKTRWWARQSFLSSP